MSIARKGVSDRTWLIIGGTGGLGRKVAEAVTAAIKQDGTDSKVVVTSRSAGTAAQVAAEIDPAVVIGLPLDATSDESVGSFWSQVEALRPTCLAYVAGGVQAEAKSPLNQSVHDIPLGAVVKQFETTLFAPIRVQHLIGNAMIAQNLDDGRKLTTDLVFLHTSSASAVHPLVRVAPYSAAMRSMDSMIESWQRELVDCYGPRVRVCGVRPGFVPTTQNSTLLLDPAAPDGLTDRGRTVSNGAILKRLGTPEEIAPAYLFLAGASFMAGTILDVDGGFNNRSVL